MTGRSRRTWVYGKNRVEVRRKLKAISDRLNKGMPGADSRGLLDSYARAWLAGTLPASDRKASTKSLYASVTRSHVIGSDLGSMKLSAIKPLHVEAWVVGLRAKGKAESTVRQAYTVLRAILETAVRDDLLARNPAAAVKRPRVTYREAEHLTPAQVRALLAASEPTRYAPLFELLVNTGMRRGEALAITWQDVDLDRETVRVTGTLSRVAGALTVTPVKTERSRRTVPLSPAAVDVFRRLRKRQLEERLAAGSVWQETPYAFTTELGEPCDPRNALRALKATANRVGLRSIGLHTLRHSAASVMITQGVPLKVVSEILGHASIAITGDVYGHVSPDVSREAVMQLSGALGG
jgi:integrase